MYVALALYGCGMWTAEHENQSIMLHRLVVSEV